MDSNYEEYGEKRLQSAVGDVMMREHSNRTALQILETIQRDVRAFTTGTPPSDDITLIVLKRDLEFHGVDE
jgi:serine phosphatase RsbU (regulator of sigma subunit)